MCGQLYVFVCVFVCVCARACVHVCECARMRVCVSPPLRLLITSGVIWNPYDWLNKFYSFCIVAVVGIVSRQALAMKTNLISVS